MNNNDRGMNIKKMLDEVTTSKIDMTNKACKKCKSGKYKETSQQDDMDGVLHCTKCGSQTKRWMQKPKKSSTVSESVDKDKLKSVYDKLNKGDMVTIVYGTSMSRDNTGKFKVTKGKTVVGASKVERITLVNEANPKGVKYYLYNRNGNIYFAAGDAAATIHSISESTVNEESVDTFSTGQDTFAGYPVFTVSGQEYSNCIDGRKKHERWNKRLNMNNETSSAIRRYNHKNPGKPIVIRNEDTGEMIFLRRKNPN
jgi:uncharacterized Zn finger protein (UPF0148 family)